MKKRVVIVLALVVVVLAWWGFSVYPDWLWFGKLHYSSVFWTMFLARFGTGAAIWLFLLLVILLNLYVAGRFRETARPGPVPGPEGDLLVQLGFSGRSAGLLLGAFALVVSLVLAQKGASQWDMVLRFFHQRPFGTADPVFHRDIGFFVFSLPFYLFIQNGLLVLLVFSAVVTAAWYMKKGAILIINTGANVPAEDRPAMAPKVLVDPAARSHLLFLGAVGLILLAWGYRLKMFNLLFSTAGAAFGAGYTDIHVRLVGYGAMIFVSLAFAVLLFVNAFGRRMRLVPLGAVIWVGMMLLAGTVLPMAVQKIVVRPNELARESAYIARTIQFTRKAYNLNRIKEVDFPVTDKLSMEDISADRATIRNIRIWDKRPLLQTYNQIQSIRLYYDFNDVDVDRYRIKGAYRQVMLSARELSVNQLPPQAKTWVNRHLIYTHGYGLVSSLVNRVTVEGLPDLIIKDLPPNIDFDMRIEHPEIYYGERTDEPVLVKSRTKEFDYPKGDKNVYTHYKGTGGVPIGTFVRRALFSLEFLDPQILFTTYLGPESRIMYNRRIDRRVRAIAPFLDYDGDPYLVVSNGRLFWIQDAYTTSNMYPYAARSFFNSSKWLNYIRNSVKIVIDAYNGDVTFYLVDEKDPIAGTIAGIFPGLFKPFDRMPEDLKKHVRYPKDLFRIQADVYRTYHMKDVQVFYNQEDLWQMPDEIYGRARQKMEPYYIIIRLPEEKTEEYVLMLPFTPSKKDNMIAWLAARCDVPGYGNMIVYKLPKEKLVFGPMQIEARIDQQTQISKEMTLWGQRGSVVIRGNLLAIPIRDTFIYVEPVYLQARQSDPGAPGTAAPRGRGLGRPVAGRDAGSPGTGGRGAAALPELKRVIVSFGNRVVMEKDLERALFSVLGGRRPAGTPSLPGAGTGPPVDAEAAARALAHFKKARTLLRQGDWAGFGRELKILEKALTDMAVSRKRRDPEKE